ncbi:MAG TPA: 2Fe-2S iron-sulfur cluster-binding protein, partial [bacterium]|nr:2Fe-2S iron-sulfur cluster-binding protein [bacterium]
MNLEVDGKKIEAKKGDTILTALKREGISVPTLCYKEGLSPTGACRLCVVEVEGARNLVPSCAYPAEEGMVVRTRTPRVLEARKTIIELLLASHPQDCFYCDRNETCELRELADRYGVNKQRLFNERQPKKIDISSPSIVRDPNKCILCGRCVRVCEEI